MRRRLDPLKQSYRRGLSYNNIMQESRSPRSLHQACCRARAGLYGPASWDQLREILRNDISQLTIIATVFLASTSPPVLARRLTFLSACSSLPARTSHHGDSGRKKQHENKESSTTSTKSDLPGARLQIMNKGTGQTHWTAKGIL